MLAQRPQAAGRIRPVAVVYHFSDFLHFDIDYFRASARVVAVGADPGGQHHQLGAHAHLVKRRPGEWLDSMTITKTSFGKVDGKPVDLYTLNNSNELGCQGHQLRRDPGRARGA